MKKIFLYSLIIILLGTISARAATGDEYTLLEPLPCIEGTGNNCEQGTAKPTINLETYIGYIFKFAIALAVLLSVIMIIWGGFQYMLSEVPFIKGNAKDRIQNAIYGLLGALVSYIILLTIDPRLVQINTTIPPLKINLSEINAFRKQIGQEILDEANKNKINNLNENIEILEKQKDDLNSKYRYIQDSTDPNYMSEEEYQTKLAIINQNIENRKIDKIQIYASDAKAAGLFDSGIAVMRNEQPSTDKIQSLAAARSKIETTYTGYINDLKTIQGPEAASVAHNLAIEKDFYMQQLVKESQISGTIEGYKIGNTQLSWDLNQYKTEAQSIINTQGPLYSDPKLDAEARKLAQDRINLITNVLKPTTNH